MTLLADLTWPEAGRLAAAGALLAIPVGSTEQHGPHLPLSTDTDIAVALTGRLAARRPGVVVAPPVSYGSSGEHAGFAGTLSIGQAAVELVLTELGRSAAETFGHLVFVCAHGGNAAPARQAVARCSPNHGTCCSGCPSLRPARTCPRRTRTPAAPRPRCSWPSPRTGSGADSPRPGTRSRCRG